MDRKLVIGIDGLGLIGGSMAKAFNQSDKVVAVVGKDINDDVHRMAFEEGVISNKKNEYSEFEKCDIVFICTPVEYIADEAEKIRNVTDAVITDAGSVKKNIIDEIEKRGISRFIGGHPMSGSDRSGFAVSNGKLFENTIYPIVPVKSSTNEDIEMLIECVRLLSAEPVVMTAEEHDESVAVISHLPHIVASVLCVEADNHSKKNSVVSALAAGGFRDITRIASSSSDLWSDILSNSKTALIPAVEVMIESLKQFRQALLDEDREQITSLLKQGREYREKIATSGKGLLLNYPVIQVDVEDKPGEIARIATVLSENGISIQNINIQNARDYEGGVMRITLQEERDAEFAKELLGIK